MFVTVEDPDHFEQVKRDDGHVCGFHTIHPGKPHPNIALRHGACGCRGPRYDSVRLSPAEITKVEARKRRAHEDAILLEAETIRQRRAVKAAGEDHPDAD